MASKKKQHFVPRFYLKYFSLNSLGKTISIFNLPSSKFISSGNLKDQAYKNYFYGSDFIIEDALSEIEEVAALIIKNILDKNITPTKFSEDYTVLLTFVVLLNARTVYSVAQTNELFDKLFKAIISKDSRVPSILKDGQFLLESPRHIVLGQTASLLPLTFDLGCKLIINKTQKPFITSDHPVVLYNQFLEPRKKFGNNIGLACKGLEIFFPLSPSHFLIFFDQDVYKIGDKSNSPIIVTSPTDVQALNLLQCISSHENLYFNQQISESQICYLVKNATQYRRETKANVNEYLKSENDKETRIILHTYTSDIKCRLHLSFINLLKKAKKYEMGDKVLHVRNQEICNLYKFFMKLVEEGKYQSGDFSEFLKDINCQTVA